MKIANGKLEHGEHEAGADEGVVEADLLEPDEQRDQQRRVRDHEDREREQEQGVLAGEGELGERVPAEQRGEHRDDHRGHRDDQRVAQVGQHAGLVVGERHVVAEAVPVDLRRTWLRRHRAHGGPDQRVEEEDGEATGDDVVRRPPDDPGEVLHGGVLTRPGCGASCAAGRR
ncbi:hypothetical protein [Cellulomonas soli]